MGRVGPERRGKRGIVPQKRLADLFFYSLFNEMLVNNPVLWGALHFFAQGASNHRYVRCTPLLEFMKFKIFLSLNFQCQILIIFKMFEIKFF